MNKTAILNDLAKFCTSIHLLGSPVNLRFFEELSDGKTLVQENADMYSVTLFLQLHSVIVEINKANSYQ